LSFTSTLKSKNLSIHLSSFAGKLFQPQDKKVALIIHNCNAKRIFINGKNVTFKTNKNTIEIPVSWEKESEKEIKIQL